jgi:glucosamine--fructose-6-phosphate aminotransferase (isomerizing)
VIAHLVTDEMKGGKTPVEAVKAALPRLRGAFALAFLFAGEEDLLIGARKGSPLAVGYGDGEMFLGSDAIALAPFTDTISYLEDGDWAVVTRSSVEVHNAKDQVVERAVLKSNASAFLVDKGNHRHFMAKEIHEQPEVVGHTLAHYLDMGNERVALPMKLPFDFKKIERVAISACGTAYYAGLVAKYWFERFARLPVEIDVASEFATARRRSIRAISRCSFRNRARPPTRWRRCATPKSRSSTCFRSSTCRPRRSPARATW